MAIPDDLPIALRVERFRVHWEVNYPSKDVFIRFVPSDVLSEVNRPDFGFDCVVPDQVTLVDLHAVSVTHAGGLNQLHFVGRISILREYIVTLGTKQMNMAQIHSPVHWIYRKDVNHLPQLRNVCPKLNLSHAISPAQSS